MRIRDIEEIRWMKQHVEGEEWTPWERKRKKKDDEDSDESDGSGDESLTSSGDAGSRRVVGTESSEG